MKLNLGCGFRHEEGFVNIDNREECHPDLLCDLSGRLPFEDNSIGEIRAFDFLEHLYPDDAIHLIEEIYRVLAPNGKFESLTPSTIGNGAFMDLHHRSFWNRCSWIYFTDDAHRELYGTKAKFKGNVQDVITNTQLNVIHTHAVLYACK